MVGETLTCLQRANLKTGLTAPTYVDRSIDENSLFKIIISPEGVFDAPKDTYYLDAIKLWCFAAGSTFLRIMVCVDDNYVKF